MTGMSEEFVANSLVRDFAVLGFDLRSSDFPRRYVEEWIRKRSLLSKYERLLELMRLRETEETGGSAPPGHTQDPAIGTTVGDLSGFPAGDGPADENSDAYVEELRRQLENMFNQGGIRVGRGEAGSTDSRNPLEGSSPTSGENSATKSEVGAVIGLVMSVWAALNAQAAKDKAEAEARMRGLEARAAQQDAEIQKLKDELSKLRKGNPAKRPVVDEVSPGGTLSVGGMAPKQPDDLGDPIQDDPRTEPSNVLKQRDQATDPNPAAEDFGTGALKAIRITSDAVTDPPRSPEPASISRKFLGRTTPK